MTYSARCSRESVDYYRCLQLMPDASLEDITAAYRCLARQYHPDRNTSTEAIINFRTISEAYQTLSHAQRRTEYDQSSTSTAYYAHFIDPLSLFRDQFGSDPMMLATEDAYDEQSAPLLEMYFSAEDFFEKSDIFMGMSPDLYGSLMVAPLTSMVTSETPSAKNSVRHSSNTSTRNTDERSLSAFSPALRQDLQQCDSFSQSSPSMGSSLFDQYIRNSDLAEEFTPLTFPDSPNAAATPSPTIYEKVLALTANEDLVTVRFDVEDERGSLKRNSSDSGSSNHSHQSHPKRANMGGRHRNDPLWDVHFKGLRDFISQFQHANVPYRYLNGGLGTWVKNQRANYRKQTLAPDRIAKLNSVGFAWVVKEAPHELRSSSSGSTITTTTIVKREPKPVLTHTAGDANAEADTPDSMKAISPLDQVKVIMMATLSGPLLKKNRSISLESTSRSATSSSSQSPDCIPHPKFYRQTSTTECAQEQRQQEQRTRYSQHQDPFTDYLQLGELLSVVDSKRKFEN